MSNIIIIYDTEATCWAKADGKTSSWWSEDWQEPEIIQIAALKLDARNFNQVAAPFNILIKPSINPTLSPYCTKLTSITDAQLAKDGVSFKDAALAFQNYCGRETPLSYGDDHRYLNYNRDDLYGLSIPPFIGQDLRPLFMAIDPATQHINSGRLAAHFGLNAKIQEHYALEDCRSIQAALKHFQNHPELLSYFKRPSP